MNHDVFISYSSKNPEAAQAICHVLEENGIKCWMAPRDIPLGSKYAAVISQAIKGSKAVVLVFSEQSAISPWVESEINIAFSNHKPIFPYKIDKAVLEKYDEFYLMLNSRHWIDSYPDFRTRFDELVQTVGKYVGVDVEKKSTSQPQVPPVPEPPVPPTPKPRRRWWLWALIAVLAVAVGVGLFGGDRGKGSDLDIQQHQADSLAQVIEAERHRSDSLALVAQHLEKEKSDRAEQERIAKEKAEKERIAKEKAEKERIAKEKAEKDRIAQEQKAKAEAERKAAEKADAERKAAQQAAKTYKVGDYYNENGKEGVVFDVWDDGRHGKIVSLDQTTLQWCTLEQRDKEIVVGADSKSNGKVNTDKVMARGDSDQYSPFVWCHQKGKDWYLPALDELKLLLLNDSIHDVVNKTLAQKGGTKLYDKGEIEAYWSSTECSEFDAWRVDMGNGYTSYGNKGYYGYVRAVSAF